LDVHKLVPWRASTRRYKLRIYFFGYGLSWGGELRVRRDPRFVENHTEIDWF
jgi:hypothetical protein